MRVFSDLRTCEYGASGHPEAPFRVRRTHELLTAAGLSPELPVIQATSNDAALVHGPKHLDSIKKGSFQDPDTPAFPGMDGIALISLSGALSAADSALAGTPSFSLMRPPGHHAGKDRVAGFCYLNNIAAASARIQAKKPKTKILIVDFDVHHGDGTQALVMNKENVSFVSTHQFPLYPGTGGRSEDNCVNIPLPAGTDEGVYLKNFVPSFESLLESFKPEVIAVSAGFDAYKEDPIAGLRLDKTTFKKIGSLLAQTKLPRFAVLEGGYSDDLPYLVEQFLHGFA